MYPFSLMTLRNSPNAGCGPRIAIGSSSSHSFRPLAPFVRTTTPSPRSREAVAKFLYPPLSPHCQNESPSFACCSPQPRPQEMESLTLIWGFSISSTVSGDRWGLSRSEGSMISIMNLAMSSEVEYRLEADLASERRLSPPAFPSSSWGYAILPSYPSNQT